MSILSLREARAAGHGKLHCPQEPHMSVRTDPLDRVNGRDLVWEVRTAAG